MDIKLTESAGYLRYLANFIQETDGSMINCVIIDDEMPARESLNLMLNRYFSTKVKVTGMAGTLSEGVEIINKNHPDLVFLDIEMPGEDGFKIFNYYQRVNFSVVFTTAYKEYAIKAIKVAALDYILKPISVESLTQAISLFEKKHLAQITNDSVEKLLATLENVSVTNGKVALPTFTGFQLEKVSDIVYCEADQSYSWVYLLNGEKLLISKSLGALQELLPQSIFYRIHKSHLVNLNYIKSLSKAEGLHITLENGVRLVVASRRKDDFIKVLTQR